MSSSSSSSSPPPQVRMDGSSAGCNAVVSAADDVPEKPTRPLTAYHLFFQLEREYIIQTTKGDKEDGAAAAPKSKKSKPGSAPAVDDRPIGKELDPAMPFRYRYIRLNPTWYASGSGKRLNNGGKSPPKRKHRKTHGKIGFLDLSKLIASRWAELEEKDFPTKQYVGKIAARELEIYKGEMKIYKASVAKAGGTLDNNKKITPCNCDSCTSGQLKKCTSSNATAAPSDRASMKTHDVVPHKPDAMPSSPKTNDRMDLKDCITRLQSANFAQVETYDHHVPSKSDGQFDGMESRPSTPKISNRMSMEAEYEHKRPIRRTISETYSDRQLDYSNERTHEVEDKVMTSACNGPPKSFDSVFNENENDDSPAEFSFHPVPSCFWKRYKKRSSKRSSSSRSSRRSSGGGSRRHRRSSDYDYDSYRASKKSSRYDPYRHTSSRSRRSWPNVDEVRDRGFERFQESGSDGRDYDSTQTDFEDRMDGFLTNVGYAPKGGRPFGGSGAQQGEQRPMRVSLNESQGQGLEDAFGTTVNITEDDAMGLMKVLSDGDE